MRRLIFAALTFSLAAGSVVAQEALPIVVEGRVPDDAAKQELLRRLRAAYPGTPIKDQLEVGGATAPPGWSSHVGHAIDGSLTQVTGAVFRVDGTKVRMEGNVKDDAARTTATQRLHAAFGDTFTIETALRADAPQGRQAVLDQTLANRTVQFESGSAVLTPAGIGVLDEMAAAIAKVGMPALDIIGHTDGAGDRQANVLLSMARADTVKAYLARKGIDASRMVVSGRGPDQPVADNATPTGRARNRRIEFLVRQ